MTELEGSEPGEWATAISTAELAKKGRAVVKLGGKQILLWQSGDAIYACNNRCPHEGYPLREGTLSEGCVLTCNWHNWKFNLDTGENLFGGDELRTYPIEVRGNDIWIDITDLPYQERYTAICNSLHDAFDDYSYDRIAREIARPEKSRQAL